MSTQLNALNAANPPVTMMLYPPWTMGRTDIVKELDADGVRILRIKVCHPCQSSLKNCVCGNPVSGDQPLPIIWRAGQGENARLLNYLKKKKPVATPDPSIAPYLSLSYWLKHDGITCKDDNNNVVAVDSPLVSRVIVPCCPACKTSAKAHRCETAERKSILVWDKADGFNTKAIATIITNAKRIADSNATPVITDPIPKFPSELKSLDFAWGVYKMEQARDKKTGELKVDVNGNPVMTKVPYNSVSHWRGNPSHKGSGNSFQESCAALASGRGYLGVCFGFLYESGLTGIDIDDCRNPETGEILPWVMEIIREVNSYTEASPSGTGVHIVSKGWQVPWDGTPDGRQGRHCGIEIYSGKHYFTVTGNHIEGTPTTVETRDLSNIFKKVESRVYEKYARSTAVPEENGDVKPTTRTDYGTLVYGGKKITTKRVLLMTGEIESDENPFRIADEWDNHVEYKSQSEADMALVSLIAREVSMEEETIREEFGKSNLYRDKAERDVLSADTLARVIKDAREAASLKAPAETVVLDEIPEDPTATWKPDLNQEFVVDYPQTALRDLTFRLFGKSITYAVITEKGTWMRFNGKHWVEVGAPVIRELVCRASNWIRDKMIPAIQGDSEYVEKQRKYLKKIVSECHDVTFVNKVATWMTAHQTPCTAFDQNDMLVNFRNGTYDFVTREFRAFDPADLMTKIMSTNYNPTAECPVFLQVLENAFDNPEMRRFLIRYFGYCLLGICTEKSFVLLHGEGDNGKTDIMETIAAILGSYAECCEWDTFSKARSGSIRNDIACLHGARFVYCDEGDRDMEVAEGKLKAMSGDGSMKARFLNKENFTFRIRFKMMLATNKRPKMSVDDPALRSRVKDVHMEKSFRPGNPKRIPGLKAKLWAEREGIAALLVQGALEFLAGGLNPPEEVKMNTDAYFKQQNPLEEFVDDHCDRTPGTFVSRLDFLRAFNSWASQNGGEILDDRELAERLRAIGVVDSSGHDPRGWADLALKRVAATAGKDSPEVGI